MSPPPAAAEQLQLVIGVHYVARCVHALAELGIADAIGNDAVAIADVARATNTEADALRRVFRLLSSYGVFASDDHMVEHTDSSRFLRSDQEGSLRDYARMLGLPVNWRGIERLDHSLRTGEAALPQSLPKGIWDHLAAHPQEAAIFDAAMAAKASAHIAAILASYDFSGFRRLVDVGGGRGHLLTAVLDAVPSARGVLFDLPHVIEAARATPHPRLDYQAGDFFADALPAGDGYIVMEVLHDWPDAEAARIVAAVGRAATSGARLLVVETVCPSEPGLSWAKTLDILMLGHFAGKQRTRAEYEQLLDAHGFALRREIDTGAGISIFEADAIDSRR